MNLLFELDCLSQTYETITKHKVLIHACNTNENECDYGNLVPWYEIEMITTPEFWH